MRFCTRQHHSRYRDLLRPMIMPLVVLVVLPGFLHSQSDVYLRVYDAGQVRVPVKLLPVQLQDEATPKVGDTVIRILQNDLWLSSLIIPHSSEDTSLNGADPFGAVPESAARMAVEMTVSMRESMLVLQAGLIDSKSGTSILRKNYRGCGETLRLLVHSLADDLVNTLTGQAGIAKSRIAFTSDTKAGKELFVMDYDGLNAKQVSKLKTALFTPGWSHNSRGLLFSSHQEEGQGLFALDVVSGKSEILVGDGSLALAPVWSPDGRKIAFVSTKHDNPEIYTMDVNGKKLVRLTHHPAIDSSPTWSPTSREIAFSSDRLGSPQVYIMDAEGSNVRRLPLEGSYNDSPCWSPRGDKIAFVSLSGAGFDIFVYDVGSEAVSQLTQDAGNNEDPAWAPDGYRIAFSSTREGRRDVYTMRWDGTDVTRLTFSGGCSSPAWSWNSRPKEDYSCKD